MKRKEIEKKARDAYAGARLASLGIEMGVCVVVGLGLGYWIDEQYATSPAGILGGLVVGLSAAARSIAKTLKAVSLESKSDSDEDPP